jgi:hypothetical protein
LSSAKSVLRLPELEHAKAAVSEPPAETISIAVTVSFRTVVLIWRDGQHFFLLFSFSTPPYK